MTAPSRVLDRRRLRSLLAVVAGLLLAAPAVATTVPSVSVSEVGGSTWTPSSGSLGCTTPDATGAFTCTGSTSQILSGDATNVSWNMALDPEPSVSNVIGLTNSTASTQTYILTVSLPVSALSAPIEVGGSVSGSLTDSNNTAGATLTTASPAALYTALIDGSNVATLYPDPASFSVSPGFGSTTIPAAAFGTPIPSQVLSQGVSSSIGIQIEFTLTPGDSASFTSSFVVLPVPEPGTLLLLASAAAGLLAARRRPAPAR